jgi:hypothetical protein
MEVLHPSRVAGSAQRARYYLRNQKRKLMIVKACGNNARRKKCQVFLTISQKEKALLESQERDGRC